MQQLRSVRGDLRAIAFAEQLAQVVQNTAGQRLYSCSLSLLSYLLSTGSNQAGSCADVYV